MSAPTDFPRPFSVVEAEGSQKRAYVTDAIYLNDPETGEDLGPYFASGFVWPSEDGSEWVVELKDAFIGKQRIQLNRLSDRLRERAEDELAWAAQRAEGPLHV